MAGSNDYSDEDDKRRVGIVIFKMSDFFATYYNITVGLLTDYIITFILQLCRDIHWLQK